MIKTAARSYSTKGPGFLTDLLSRIEAMPGKSVKKDGISAKKSVQSTNKIQRQLQVKVADHPLASLESVRRNKFEKLGNLSSNEPTGKANYQRNASRGAQRDTPRSNRRDFAPSKSSTGGGGSFTRGDNKRPNRLPRRNLKPIEMKKKLEPQSKLLVYSEYKANASHNLFHSRSTQLNHSKAGRIASVAKEILLELKYPYQLPKNLVEAAPERAQNTFILQKSSFNTEVLLATLKSKLDATLRGRTATIDVKASQVPKGLEGHAKFVERNLLLNPSLSTVDRQRMYEAASGISPVALLVKGSHWLSK